MAYLTVKGSHGGIRRAHWRLSAILQVIARFEGHEAGAAWYRSQGLDLPKNCMVQGNGPLDLDQTGGTRPGTRFGDPQAEPTRVIRRWNYVYQKRARECGVFLVTRAIYLELHDPPVLSEDDLHLFGGRMPGTQTPPRVDGGVLERLRLLALQQQDDQAA